MQTFRKRRLELVVEQALAETALATIEAAGARYWVMAPTLGGQAGSGAWRPGLPAAGLGGVSLVTVGEAAMIEALAERLLERLRDNAAVLLLSDVEVLRPAHF